jgi:outer membrane biosynthesis protein TonB
MTSLTIIASIEGLLVFVVIVLLSALSNWLKQRKELEQQRRRNLPGPSMVTKQSPQAQAPPTGQPTHPAPPPKLDWEEQLRRLLEGDIGAPEPEVVPEPTPTSAEPPPKKAVPPPLIAQTGPMKPEEHVQRPQAVSGAPARQPEAAPAPMSPAPSPHPQSEQSYTGTSVSSELAKLEASAAAYKRAAELAAQTAAKLEEIARLRGVGGYERSRVPTGGVSPEVLQVREMLGNPRSASQALIAAVILGPPRALKETPGELWASP